MIQNLDLKKDHVVVGGRLPLYYMQDGRGYNRKGEFLGFYNDQGEPTEAPEADPVPQDPPLGDVDNPDDQGDTDTEDNQDPAQAPTPEPDPYAGKQAKTLKRMLEERGLDYEPDATKEQLTALLVADDNKKKGSAA